MRFLKAVCPGVNKCWPILPSDKNSTCQTFCTRETVTTHAIMIVVHQSALDHEHTVVTKFMGYLVLFMENSSSGKSNSE
jgi:hypothetical protein